MHIRQVNSRITCYWHEVGQYISISLVCQIPLLALSAKFQVCIVQNLPIYKISPVCQIPLMTLSANFQVCQVLSLPNSRISLVCQVPLLALSA